METRLKLLTIVDSLATNSPSFFMGYKGTGEKERIVLLMYCSTVNVRSIKMKCV